MGSKKRLVIEAAARTIAARLGTQERPRFSETTATVGAHRGVTVGVQFDPAYLHGIGGPPYWLRFELREGLRYRSVIRLADGRIQIVRGIRGTGPDFTADFPFTDDAEMERLLAQVGAVIAAWAPEQE